MRNPLEAAILGPALVREVYFRVFIGEQGGSMRAALNRQDSFGRISKALRKIHSSYTEPLSVEALAFEAQMSVSSFHAHLKAMTNTPLASSSANDRAVAERFVAYSWLSFLVSFALDPDVLLRS